MFCQQHTMSPYCGEIEVPRPLPYSGYQERHNLFAPFRTRCHAHDISVVYEWPLANGRLVKTIVS